MSEGESIYYPFTVWGSVHIMSKGTDILLPLSNLLDFSVTRSLTLRVALAFLYTARSLALSVTLTFLYLAGPLALNVTLTFLYLAGPLALSVTLFKSPVRTF